MTKKNIKNLAGIDHNSSPGMKRIIGKVPPWIVRCGIGSLLLIIGMLVYVTLLIKVPIKTEVSIKFKTANGPIVVKSPLSGFNMQVLIPNGEMVQLDDPIICFDTTVNVKELKRLEEILTSMIDGNNRFEENVLPKGHFGALASDVQYFATSLRNSNDLLVKKNAYSLKQTILKWQKKHVLTSPINGRVLYSGVYQDKQLINKDDTLFLIIPNDMKVFGEMKIPMKFLSKIKNTKMVYVNFGEKDIGLAPPSSFYKITMNRPSFISDNSFNAKIDLLDFNKNLINSDFIYSNSVKRVEIVFSHEKLLFKLFPLLKLL
jgi:HlyD family secretion protein